MSHARSVYGASGLCRRRRSSGSGTCQSLVGRRCGGTVTAPLPAPSTVSGTCESGRCKVRRLALAQAMRTARATSPATLPNQNRLCRRAAPTQCVIRMTCEMQINAAGTASAVDPMRWGQAFAPRSTTGASAAPATPTEPMTARASKWKPVRATGSVCVSKVGPRRSGKAVVQTTRDDNANQCVGGATCY